MANFDPFLAKIKSNLTTEVEVPIPFTMRFGHGSFDTGFQPAAQPGATPLRVHRVIFEALKKASTNLRLVNEALGVKLLAQGNNRAPLVGLEPTTSRLWAQDATAAPLCPLSQKYFSQNFNIVRFFAYNTPETLRNRAESIFL